MEVSSLEFCTISCILREFCEDAYSTTVNQILKQISEKRIFDSFLEQILKKMVDTHPKFVNDRFLAALLSGKIQLHKLELRNCTNISVHGLAMALKW